MKPNETSNTYTSAGYTSTKIGKDKFLHLQIYKVYII
jgi:hypothetical protein